MTFVRSAVAAALVFSLLAAPLAADAQPAAKTARIGFLSANSVADPRVQPFVDAFRQGLRDLGWVSLLISQRTRIAELAIKHRLATIYGLIDHAKAGGLVAYGPNTPDLYRRATIYVDKILKGAKPGDLPIEQPTKFELVVNLKTAKALGVTVPPSLLLRADQVIE